MANNAPRINGRIRVPEVRVIDPEGNQLGIMSVSDALSEAEEYELDLVEVAPKANPPVCRIMDYGKYMYQQKKRSNEQRKRSARVELKEVKMRPKTDTHDFDVKIRKAAGFLEEGHKVKITIVFRGREITHPEIARDLLDRAREDLEEISSVLKPAGMESRAMVMILQPARSEE